MRGVEEDTDRGVVGLLDHPLRWIVPQYGQDGRLSERVVGRKKKKTPSAQTYRGGYSVPRYTQNK